MPVAAVHAEDCLLDRDNDGNVDAGSTDNDGGANSNGDNRALACGIGAIATGANGSTALGSDAAATGGLTRLG